MKQNRGFTLIELMVALAVGVLLLVVGIPSFRSTIQNYRITTQANEFLGALNLARGEAVKRNTVVRITALDATDAANEWGQGWRVWVDSNGNGAYDAGEEIRVSSALSGSSTLDSVENVSEIQFLATGFLNIAAGTTLQFQLRIPDCTGDQGRDITLVPTGRANSAKVTC